MAVRLRYGRYGLRTEKRYERRYGQRRSLTGSQVGNFLSIHADEVLGAQLGDVFPVLRRLPVSGGGVIIRSDRIGDRDSHRLLVPLGTGRPSWHGTAHKRVQECYVPIPASR